MKFIIIFVVILYNQVSDAVIYRLNDAEYLRMPPIYRFDDYDSCVYQPNGTYCYVDVNLVSDTPSDLLQIIHEYSEHTPTHFNHTQLHYGLCLTKTCKHFVQENKVVDPRMTLEKCLNESLWQEYQLKTRLSNKIYCMKLNDPMNIDVGDILAATIFICLALLNVLGTLYGFWFIKGGEGHKLLLSFSIQRNWQKLVTHENTDPLQKRLEGLYGIKVLLIIIVIIGHSPLPFVISTENTHELEKMYYNIGYHLFFNGTLLVQAFFIMTGCLMAFNIRLYFEKNNISWVLIPQLIILRWMRLTPTYAVVLIFTMTWIRFIGSGPLWETTIGAEVADCRRDAWWNMLYLNNYIDNSQCMVQTWFLAANMQLVILGTFVCILAKTSKSRSFLLSILFMIGLVIPAIHTYLQDLDAIVIISPENARNFFIADPTFNHTYKRGHTNIPAMVLGLAAGNFIYSELRDNKVIKKYEKFAFLYNFVVPICVVTLVSGIIFYGDRPKLSINLRTVIAALARPVIALLMTLTLIGMVFKFENVVRPIVEWPGWRTPAQVSYSAYLIHVAVIRIFAGMNSTLVRMGFAQLAKEISGNVSLTFLLAFPLWLFVEAPLYQVVTICLGLSKKGKKDDKDPIVLKSEKTN